MEQIVTDIEKLIADIEAGIADLEAKGKAELAVIMKVVSAQLAAVVAELKKLLGM